jgi:cell shape-determining protein MreC
MTAENTKASKVGRILTRQISMDGKLDLLIDHVGERASAEFFAALDRLESQDATIKVLSGTVQSLEAENARLREYLGSVLFRRRQVQAANAYMGNPLPHTDGL